MDLPKKFKNFTSDPRWDKYEGKPQLSYSQYTSFNDKSYWREYYVQYFSGIKSESNEFAEFGSLIGTTIEQIGLGQEITTGISDEDLKVIKENFDFTGKNKYEDFILIDCGWFVIIGFADRVKYLPKKTVEVEDVKTLNIKTKSSFYVSDEYQQTNLYAYFFESDGFKIKDCSVVGFGRRGNSINGTGNYKMRLDGEVVKIPTPYTKERAEKAISKIKETAEQIAKEYEIYQKLFV